MRTLICFCLLLGLSQTIISQEYIPVINKENRWHILTDWRSTFDTAGKETNILKFSSDTIIDGKEYSILLQSYDSLAIKWEELGLLREDITTRRVYFSESSSGEYKKERLLYDFGAEVNDTILSVPSKAGVDSDIHYIIKSIDQVDIAGKEHRRFTVSIDYEGVVDNDVRTWIEGIGDIYDFLFDANHRFLMGGERKKTLLAFYQGDKWVYNPHGYDTDFIWVPPYALSNEDIEMTSNFDISMNHRMLTIRNKKEDACWIDLYTIEGKQLMHHKSNSFETDISLETFQVGVYVVNVYSTSYRTSKKIQLKN